jgi:DNA-binding transcriptional MerR regulator
MADAGAIARNIEARRRLVARLHNAGYSVPDIQAELKGANFKNVSRPTVYRDLEVLREEWQAANAGLIEEQRDRHMQRLDDDLEHLTRQGMRITDPAEMGAYYAGTILPLLKERAKVRGLYAPRRTDITEFVRNWAREQGLDPDVVHKLVDNVVKSTGF